MFHRKPLGFRPDLEHVRFAQSSIKMGASDRIEVAWQIFFQSSRFR